MTAPLKDLAPLVALLPKIEAEGATFGEMTAVEKAKDGSVVMPWFEFNDLGNRFHSLGHVVGDGISLVDWGAWEVKKEAFLSDFSLISSASVDDIRRLIVTIVRAERFCEGAMQSALEIGLVGTVIRRAAALMLE